MVKLAVEGWMNMFIVKFVKNRLQKSFFNNKKLVSNCLSNLRYAIEFSNIIWKVARLKLSSLDSLLDQGNISVMNIS